MWFSCPACEGMLIGVGPLQKLCKAAAIQNLWVRARQANQLGDRLCPECTAPMLVVTAPEGRGPPFDVDTCPRCYVIWLDRGKLEKLPGKPEREAELEKRAKERREEHERRERQERLSEISNENPPDPSLNQTLLELILELLSGWE